MHLGWSSLSIHVFVKAPDQFATVALLAKHRDWLAKRFLSWPLVHALLVQLNEIFIVCTIDTYTIESWKECERQVLSYFFEGPVQLLFIFFCRVQFFVGSDALESHLLVALFGKYFIGKPLMHFPEKRWSSLRIVSILKYTIDCCYVIVQQQQEIVVLYL